MKELEQVHDAPGTRVLKSLLKKPGQGKQRTHKNRVVINEKLNEFFAADYIILIKEECCADYEEECDCCCQEPEMIRLGNCKECRAELLSRHLAGGGSGGEIEQSRYTQSTDGKIELIDNTTVSSRGQHCNPITNESHCDDEDEDEEEEYEEEVDDDDDDDNDEAESSEEIERDLGIIPTSLSSDYQQKQQHETLSPPEGYKDVCDEDTGQIIQDNNTWINNVSPHESVVVCNECNYYHRQQQASDGDVHKDDKNECETSNKSALDESNQDTNEQPQQATPDIHQRYLVETITMTTVTERRIVREISEDKTSITNNSSAGVDQTDTINTSIGNGTIESTVDTTNNPHSELNSDKDKKLATKSSASTVASENDKETSDPAGELSLTFKLGNVSLVTNSFKPNSAVRQLFPNPRFISPPPALSKNITGILSNDDATDSDSSEAQRYLVTTESLRLFDSVKRAKMAGARSDSSESDSSTIKRTIERNALRRSLVCKYDTGSKKKNLVNRDLTLEERIRQLTCVDQDDEDKVDSSALNSGTNVNDNTIENNGQLTHEQLQELPMRTSPSGEERPMRNERVVRPLNDCHEHSPSPPLHHHHHHHHYHHHHHQSAYRKITDQLFGQKKIDNMPDLGIGDRSNIVKSSLTKINSDARKQFLASLTPLSCVASTAVDAHQDYYQLSSKMSSNRDSISYNSDSSYSLEDIEAALCNDETRNCKNNCGPPDVTRGTPTGMGPGDATDATTDELLAFVEQDKTRTERLKRRYDTDDHHDEIKINNTVEKIVNNNVIQQKNGENNINKNEIDNDNADDDDDDELNDYGFNRRPSVRGIKPQFETTNEIVQQLRYRTVPTSLGDKNRGIQQQLWSHYDTESVDKRVSFIHDHEELINGKTRDNTINRINTMQRQIDDIYQTIAETSVSVQGNIERGSYLESTLPRNLPPSRIPATTLPVAECHRYEQNNGVAPPQFQDPQRLRMTEVQTPTSVYNSTLPPKARRATVAISNYPCGVVPVENTKCYRTMYLVPYNGITDPTYQNIQRILPPHSSSPNYANHIERYPYPRNLRIDNQQQQQQIPRYYPRTPPGPTTISTGATPQSQSNLHLHLHHQSDNLSGFNASSIGMQTVQLQHHQHISQLATYNVQSIPTTYTVMAPSTATGYHPYPVHPNRIAADVQTQTVTLSPAICNTVSSGSGYNGINGQHLVSASSSSSTSSTLSSPTKINHQMNTICTTAERGVPEGAASAPAHDYVSQSNNIVGHNVSNSFIGHSNNVPPPNTQNSVYYAMNV
ncbi:hypothetical protein PV327_003207 [Microctonus hyperodae]|uniref:Uncharacterized protein n=2 Tax=Microctonus hyperodae TaxID=165561 RepID=A0AA39G4H0_MICHY|nr:hypothetical protein PV327_003207 [Microctonus hyperodae]